MLWNGILSHSASASLSISISFYRLAFCMRHMSTSEIYVKYDNIFFTINSLLYNFVCVENVENKNIYTVNRVRGQQRRRCIFSCIFMNWTENFCLKKKKKKKRINILWSKCLNAYIQFQKPKWMYTQRI